MYHLTATYLIGFDSSGRINESRALRRQGWRSFGHSASLVEVLAGLGHDLLLLTSRLFRSLVNRNSIGATEFLVCDSHLQD